MVRRELLAFCAAMSSLGHAGADPTNLCPAMLPSALERQIPRRAIGTSDLVELREFGPGDGRFDEPSLFAISPDGRSVALLLRRGNIDANAVCTALVLIDTETGRATLLDTAPGFLRDQADWRGLGDLRSSFPVVVAPRFAADGRAIFYLRPTDGTPQVWRAEISGRPPAQVTQSPVAVIDFDLTPDGSTLLFSSRPGLVRARAAIAAEARRGWVYDDRFWSIQRSAPFPPTPPEIVNAVDLRTAGVSIADKASLAGTLFAAHPAIQAASTDGRLQARIVAARPGEFGSTSRLSITRDRRELHCPEEVCGDQVWGAWNVGDRILVLRTRADAIDNTLDLLAWQPGENVPKRIWSSHGRLLGCQKWRDELLCGYDDAATPLRLVTLNLRRGSLRTIWDPNPIFARLRLGTVERLTWTDANGVSAYGDLVLPPAYRVGTRIPLAVVQYESRGFLRGGSGGDYPVHLLAAAGYAVFSLHQPRAAGDRARGVRTLDEYQARMMEGFWYRRRLQASLETAIDLLVRRGVADRARIGLTGMSDGAATACFALSGGLKVAAVALSSGCEDPGLMSWVGPNFSSSLVRWGYPPPYSDDRGFWQRLSPALNAAHIDTPVLIQSADTEHRMALEMIQAFRSHHRPIEMIVYPDEDHVKWQPAHKAAVFDTTIAWFDFWIRQREPNDLAQRSRWDALRRQARHTVEIRPTSAAPMSQLPPD